MSIDLVAAALWLPLEPNRKLVLIALCERADFRTGLCWPGREEIAIRASLSPKRTGEHLKALKDEGWVRREERGRARLKETTKRWLNVDRILEEGEQIRSGFRAKQLELLGDETSPDPFQGRLLGDDPDALGDVAGNDQGTIDPTLGDAASLVTVRSDPSSEPSDQTPIPDRVGDRISSEQAPEPEVPDDHQAEGPSSRSEDRSVNQRAQKARDELWDPVEAFATAMMRQMDPEDISEYFGAGAEVEITGDVVRLKISAAPPDRLAGALRRCALAAGCSRWEVVA